MTSTIKGVEKRKALAERFFRGVYSGVLSVVDELAAEAIVASYPIFQRLFGTQAIKGIEAYREHAANFNGNWKDAEVVFHRVVGEGHTVVMMWSFSARRVNDGDADSANTSARHSWGGITFIEFDNDDRIIAEMGEESEPGPIGRLTATGL